MKKHLITLITNNYEYDDKFDVNNTYYFYHNDEDDVKNIEFNNDDAFHNNFTFYTKPNSPPEKAPGEQMI